MTFSRRAIAMSVGLRGVRFCFVCPVNLSPLQRTAPPRRPFNSSACASVSPASSHKLVQSPLHRCSSGCFRALLPASFHNPCVQSQVSPPDCPASRPVQSRLSPKRELVTPFGSCFPVQLHRASSRFLTTSMPHSARGLQVYCALLPTMGFIAFCSRCAECRPVAGCSSSLPELSSRCSHPPESFPRQQPVHVTVSCCPLAVVFRAVKRGRSTSGCCSTVESVARPHCCQ
jgi:hypothetical protein